MFKFLYKTPIIGSTHYPAERINKIWLFKKKWKVSFIDNRSNFNNFFVCSSEVSSLKEAYMSHKGKREK